MDRASNIKDADYIACLPRPYRTSYTKWRTRMLNSIDAIAEAIAHMPVEDVMQKFNLSPRDIALLVRLNYFTAEEVVEYGLERIERSVPV